MQEQEAQSLFDEFMPHGMCYMWRKDILLLNVVSDLLIALAYFSIPLFLFYFFRHRRNMPFRGVVLMFSLFIFSCGVTHLLGVWTVWNGNYGVQGLGKAITASISIATALMLIPVMPHLMALRSPKELELANDALTLEIKERKKSEKLRKTLEKDRQRLGHEIAHIGRLNSMGQMATGLAHELNQPLTAIMQGADAALTELRGSNTDKREVVDLLEDLETQAFRAGEIIQGLREFVRKDDGAMTAFNVNEMVEQTLSLFGGEIEKYNITLTFYPTEIPEITAIRIQCIQVVVNLVQNAIRVLSASNTQSPEIRVSTFMEDGGIILAVEDNGPGIPNEDIFAPFFTTHSEGLGMGLSICKSIVDENGGRIWVDQNTHMTTRFCISISADKVVSQ
ncbi:MAG: ATP-binding protein [Pseudomonadota bacterium]